MFSPFSGKLAGKDVHRIRGSFVSRKAKRRQRSAFANLTRVEALEPRQLLSGGGVASTTATIVADTSNYYPNSDTPGNALTSVAFNESGCLAGVTPSSGSTASLTNGTLGLFYSDETAMTLGVSQVTTITSSGSTTTDYAVSPLNGSPGSVINPEVGAAYTPPTTLGSRPIQAGTDAEGRPMFPSLYVTDITGLDTSSVAAHAGDWQYGGTPVAPNAVYGTWKSVSETIDETGATPQISFSVPANPAKNNLNLGNGADSMPAGVSNQGYSAEVQWNLGSLNLQAGHSYRFYFMVHDGDQNKSGGDVGQAAFDLMVPQQSTPCISTCASATNGGQVGSAQLTDSVTISGGDNPTGTVSFTVTQPDGTTVAVGSPVTVNGDGTYNASTSILATELGTYTFHASYSGDANNAAAADDGQNESITTVNPPKLTPCITTCACATSNGIVGSAMLSDSVTVSGGDNPTGTVSFTLTQPDGKTISVGSPVTINGDGTYNVSTSVLASEVGTYTFHASYSGDANNNAAADDGQNESVTTIQACPTINTCASTTAGGTVGSAMLSDTATLVGGYDPTGTITFTVTQPDGKTVAVGSPVAVNGDGTYQASTTVLASEVGTYTFHAVYSGDSLNCSAQDDGQCESAIAVKASPSISTNASSTGGGSGSAKLSDTVTVTGGDNPSGTVTFTVTQPDGTILPVGSPVTINGDGTYNAPTTVLATQVGTYTFHASYSGDSLNNGAADNGQNESVTVANPPSTQIVVTKIADQASIDAGAIAGFTVEIQNVGPNAAIGLSLTDPLPAGYANDINWQIDTSGMGYGAGTEAADFVITGSAGHQVLSLAPSETSLAAGASITVHITGSTSLNDVDPNQAPCTTTLVNTATVTAANLPSNDQDVQATATITLHSVDVDVTKTADQSQIVAGQLAGFKVTIHNQGCIDATGLTLNDLLPEGPANDIFWQLDPTQNSSEYFQIVGQIGDQHLELASSITTLQPGQLISVHVIGLTSVKDCGTLNNTATVNASNEPSFEQNAQASASITVESANQNAQQAYVEAAFEATLGRAPDQASLASFVNALDNGLSRTTFAMMLTHSTEYYNDVVDRAYEHYLGRSADAAGVHYWSGQLAAGMTDEQLEAQFIGSSEYYQHSGGTDKAWVDHMYFDLLGRVPDAQGEGYWVSVLANGASRSSVALGFAASAEREGDMVKDDYQAFLGRPPMQSEIDGWVMAFENGLTNEDVIAGFVASNEFFQDHS